MHLQVVLLSQIHTQLLKTLKKNSDTQWPTKTRPPSNTGDGFTPDVRHSRAEQRAVFLTASVWFHSSSTRQSKRRRHCYCLLHLSSRPLQQTHIYPGIKSTQFGYLGNQSSVFVLMNVSSHHWVNLHCLQWGGAESTQTPETKLCIWNGEKAWRTGLWASLTHHWRIQASEHAKAWETSGTRSDAGHEWLGNSVDGKHA